MYAIRFHSFNATVKKNAKIYKRNKLKQHHRITTDAENSYIRYRPECGVCVYMFAAVQNKIDIEHDTE